MKPTRMLLTAASSLLVSQVMAGEAVFYITEDGNAMRDVAVSVDGQKQLVGSSGFVNFTIDGGSHKVELTHMGEWIGDFEFVTENISQNAEVQVDVVGGEALEDVSVYTPGQEETPAIGQISGTLQSDETGGPVSGARISIAGTETAVMTDDDGFFSFELPRGQYSLAVSHPNYGKRDVKNLRVMSGVNTGVNLTMSMSGNGMIEEVVAVGSYIPTTATAQERDSSAVLDAIGSEQMARFGDSSAASALKRVVGVTVSGGKYVVARGLNERHTSVMVNGASLPSPDPTRRVVPLDIFPSTILDGIEVQKTFTPDVYADSTGSAVSLTTKKFPAEFEGKVSASVGYNDQVTFQEREVQQSESLDFLGFGAGGDRAEPSSLTNISAMSSNLTTEQTSVLPDTSVEVSVGDTFMEEGDQSAGYTLSVKYSNSWGAEDRQENTWTRDSGVNSMDDNYFTERTTNDINLSFGVSFGLISGDSEYSSNTMLLRQTHAESSIKRGVGGDQDRPSYDYTLDWLERQFLFQQFTGDHYFEEFYDTELDWQVSVSQAVMDNPDRRTYSFDDFDSNGNYRLRWSDLDREYNTLTDDNVDFSLDLNSTLVNEDSYSLKLNYGLSMFSRSREAENSKVGYVGSGALANDYANILDPDHIVAETSAAGDTTTIDQSQASGDYDADWTLAAYYLGLDYELFDQFRVSAGARAEMSSLEVNTADFTTLVPVSAKLDDNDLFPSLSATWFVVEDVQIRGAYYETINRPDFRELAEAQYLDPENGDNTRGNSDLVSADIRNYDLRAEMYFSESESVSLALFSKDFDNPIEKILETGGGVYTFENGETGTVSGIEFDFRSEYELVEGSAFLSGNASLIDSEVTIANRTRVMQGQSDKLANLQVGYDDFNRGLTYTLVINYKGEYLYSATQSGSNYPDVYFEPRTDVDASVGYEQEDGLKWKLALKNLTDEEVQLTQAGANYRHYKTGREVSLGVAFDF